KLLQQNVTFDTERTIRKARHLPVFGVAVLLTRLSAWGHMYLKYAPPLSLLLGLLAPDRHVGLRTFQVVSYRQVLTSLKHQMLAVAVLQSVLSRVGYHAMQLSPFRAKARFLRSETLSLFLCGPSRTGKT